MTSARGGARRPSPAAAPLLCLLSCGPAAPRPMKPEGAELADCADAGALADGLPYASLTDAVAAGPARLRLCPGLDELGIDLSADLTLDGGGLTFVAPPGRSALRVLSGQVHVHDLTLLGGEGDLDPDFDGGQSRIGGVLNAWRASGLRLERVRLEGGVADWGGALMGPEDGDLELVDVELIGSTAARLGGGAWCRGGRLTRVRVADNSADYVGGLAARRGAEQPAGALELQDVRVEGNRARVQGGGLHLAGPVDARLGVEVRGNHAEQGGGLLLVDHLGLLEGGLLHGNTASAGGAGGQLVRGQTRWTGARISENRVTNEGLGALEGVGGALWTVEADLTLKGATLTGNRASWGAGLMVAGRAAPAPGGAELRLEGVRLADHLPEVPGATGAAVAVVGARLSGEVALLRGEGRAAGGLWADGAAVSLRASWSENLPGDAWDARSGPLPSVPDGALLQCSPAAGCALR